MKTFIPIFAGLLFYSICVGQENNLRDFSQTVPGDTPKVFMKTVRERIAVSNDYKEIYFNDSAGVSYYKYSQNRWNGPFELFRGLGCPALSPDNTKLFLQSRTPEIWYASREGEGWSIPVKFWSDPKTKHYLQLTDSGEYYLSYDLSSSIHGKISKLLITQSDTTIRSLGAPINSENNGLDFYISRDESYIIFVQHPGGVNGDLFISYHKDDGTWGLPKSLGSLINSSSWEWGPYVTSDNRFLFFTRGSSPSNVGVYWVRFDRLIDKLKSE